MAGSANTPIVAVDVGNSRLKLGSAPVDGSVETTSLLIDLPTWEEELKEWATSNSASAWLISTVNPPTSSRVQRILEECGVERIRWFRSAADVPLSHRLSS